jgi:hypothetical protein
MSLAARGFQRGKRRRQGELSTRQLHPIAAVAGKSDDDGFAAILSSY